MIRRTVSDMPTIEQLEVELERINKKKGKSKHTYLKTNVPSMEQVAAERARLHKSSDKKEKKINLLKKTPVVMKQSEKKKQVAIPTMEEVVAEKEHLIFRSRFRSVLVSTIGILLVVAAIAALITTLCMPVLQVSGTSMEPTLEDGDIIVLLKTGEFETGDLVGLYYNGKIMLKRVIGQSGDYINIDSDGNVYVNGSYIEEPYVTGKSLGDCDVSFPLQVPDSTCFVLGDHRSVSMDSRKAAIGCIQTEQIIGRVAVRIWPLQDFSLIH